MNNFKNNQRRNRFRSNGDRNFKKRNGNGHKLNVDFNNNSEFKRKNPGRNNQNAAKLIEKYNDLAREASSNGDKILSENYLQHADHFTRILNEKENYKREKLTENKLLSKIDSPENTNLDSSDTSENDILENSEQSEINNKEKPQVEVS